MNKNLGSLISWHDGGRPRKNTLDFLESNFLAVRETSQYKLYAKIIRRARYLRKGLIRRLFAQYGDEIKNGSITSVALKYTNFGGLAVHIRAYALVIKQYRRKLLDLLQGKDPYAAPETVVYNFLIVKSNNSIDGFFYIDTLRRNPHYLREVYKQFPLDRFDYFPHPKGFYVREKPILSDNILQPVFDLLENFGKDNNGNTRKI